MVYLIVAIALTAFLVLYLLISSKRIIELKNQYDLLKEENEKLSQEQASKQQAVTDLTRKISECHLAINTLDRDRRIATERAADAQEATVRLLKSEQERVATELKRVREVEEQRMQHEFQERARALEQQYAFKEKQFADDFLSLQEYYQDELGALRSELNEYAAKRAAVNEAIRREEELQNEIDSHRIILSEAAKEDIHYLISIEPNIHNKELLHKLIWSEYLQTPFNDMLKRVFGSRVPKNVIYCIENIKLHKKYIGKTSAEVSKRWTEHIKSSLSIGGIKHQNIHDALFEHWDEFTFSIMEEVFDSKLSEREKYYINFFETDKFGYNQKGGG